MLPARHTLKCLSESVVSFCFQGQTPTSGDPSLDHGELTFLFLPHWQMKTDNSYLHIKWSESFVQM